MKVYMDWEFIEDGVTIKPISVGMVSSDGREYYAVFRDMPVKRISKDDWLMANVVSGLPRLYGEARQAAWRSNRLGLDWSDPAIKPHDQIRDEVKSFILGDHSDMLPAVELWADYGAYDHVCLAQLFGRMIDLPEGMPMFTNDVQQEASRLGLSDKELPQQPDGLHNALADARHVKVVAEFLRNFADAA